MKFIKITYHIYENCNRFVKFVPIFTSNGNIFYFDSVKNVYKPLQPYNVYNL